jgi:hypothetical protein
MKISSKLLQSLSAFFALFIAACQNRDSSLPTPPDNASPKFKVTDFAAPEQCASCHPNHYNEWRSSMHAYAFVDPVFFAMHERGQRETGGKLDQFCTKCHSPIASLTGETPPFFLKKKIQPPFSIEYSVPFLYDWNRDSLWGLFVGERNGTIIYFRGTGSVSVADPIVSPRTFELHAYPNPFRDRLNISLRTDGALATPTPRAAIYNLLGARVADLEIKNTGSGRWRTEWQPASLHLGNGIYFLKINWGQEQVARKLLFIH